MTVSVVSSVPAVDRDLFDYSEARTRVLALVKQGMDYINEAEKISREHVPYGFQNPLDRHNGGTYEDFRKTLDGRYWQFVFDRTGAAAVMDGEARKQFRDQLQRGDVPEFTPDNITTHFLSMHQDAESMFDRGVYNLFRRYVRIGERGYETNRKHPFSIGKKLVLDRWFSTAWSARYLHIGYHAGDEVNDFGRIVNLLAGQPYSPRGFEVAINAAMADGTDVFENDLVKLRGFKNGNAHLWIKKPEILDGINAAIARYCGDTLAAAADPNYGEGGMNEGSARYWRIEQGLSTVRVQAPTHAAALRRAKAFGFDKPDSCVLETAHETNIRRAQQAHRGTL